VTAPVPLLTPEVVTLAPFVEAGVLDAAAVQVAGVVARTVGGVAPEVLLGAALAARAPLFGHVCVVIGSVLDSIVVDDDGVRHAHPLESLPWPDPEKWGEILAASPAVCGPSGGSAGVTLPLVWDGMRLYLERYWRFETRVADELLRRARSDGGLTTSSPELDALLDRLFVPDRTAPPDRQREAAEKALTRRIAVIGGGPGTGKTRTIAGLLSVATDLASNHGRRLEVALAAPTGKAAARMTAAVHEEVETAGADAAVAAVLSGTAAQTLHRLLGIGSAGKPRHDRFNRLPHDLVVVDETSMVSLPLMARLLEAVRPDATLVLVGDPYQLASVEAGAVLGEIVGPMATGPAQGPLTAGIELLERNHRYGPDSQIAALADAIRRGDADAAVEVLTSRPSEELTWVADDDQQALERLYDETATSAAKVVEAALNQDAEGGLLEACRLKVLCATRFGPLGVFAWTDHIETLTARALPGAGIGRRSYPGRPVVVTRNDYFNRLFNGDVGLVVARPAGPVVAFSDPGKGLRELAMSQLGDVDTWWATTIHKAQGSEFERVIVTLPRLPSPVLSRELVYTAVTRAKEHVTVVAAEESLRAAISRPVARESGLKEKLWPNVPPLTRN
jgi:exodeoxyribonuclease V alpha subunit